MEGWRAKLGMKNDRIDEGLTKEYQKTGNKLTSVLDMNDLEAFMHEAEARGRAFEADRCEHVEIVTTSFGVQGSLSAEERVMQAQKMELHRADLQIPRRPLWNEDTTPAELDLQEKAKFLEWRSTLAELEKDELLVFSPFEKNLEVWRQLWRVVERSDVVVQVVDARNPDFYRCPDFENYVREVGSQSRSQKRNILLLNKADLLTIEERRAWMDFFNANDIEFLFFSAFASLEAHEKAKEAAARAAAVEEEEGVDPCAEAEAKTEAPSRGMLLSTEHVLTQTELMDHLIHVSNEVRVAMGRPEGSMMTVGMVGYPNVGKSSTINALLCEKRVGVDSRPGKTKHFQTLPLGKNMTLCDCPGLVFPSFSQSKAEMYCNGVLPIDNMRDQGLGPVGVLCERIPRRVWRKTYNLVLEEREAREDLKAGRLNLDLWGETYPTAREVLEEIAAIKGMLGKHSVPDVSRSARMVLKDYVNGKLLYVYPPRNTDFAHLHGEGGVHEDKPHKAARRIKKPTGIKANAFAALDDEEDEEEEEVLDFGGVGAEDAFSTDAMIGDAEDANAVLAAALAASEEKLRTLNAGTIEGPV